MTDKNYDNSGILSRNDRKERPSQPDFVGSLRISGKDYWLSAWKKENERGKFLSLALQPKDTPEAAESKAKPKQSSEVAFNDPIDFI
jgi:hypothetical protein